MSTPIPTPEHLSTRQLAVLAALAGPAAPRTVDEVCERARPLSRTAVRSALRQLERRGLAGSRAYGSYDGWGEVWWRV